MNTPTHTSDSPQGLHTPELNSLSGPDLLSGASLPSLLPRDVLKTLIQGHIEKQIQSVSGLSDTDKEKIREELCDDRALDKNIDQLAQQSRSDHEIPIQIGFGAGAPPKNRRT